LSFEFPKKLGHVVDQAPKARRVAPVLLVQTGTAPVKE